MPSRNHVRSAVSQALIASGKSPEDWGREIGVSGMTIRRLLEPGPGPNLQLRTRMLIARGLKVNPNELWPPIAVRKRPRVAA